MKEAEKHLADNIVDIVLLDLGLPDAQGMDAVRRARAAAPTVPLVVLSGMDDERLAVEALQDGAQDYLIKGQIDSRGMQQALRYAIERKSLQLGSARAQLDGRRGVEGSRSSKRRQSDVRRQYEPRDPHAAQQHHWL